MRSENSGARHRPYFLVGAGDAVSCLLRCPEEPRARGTPRVPGASKFTQNAQTRTLGPAGLDTSRHRGLSKPVEPQVRQVRWRPARGVFRFAPQRPRWTDPLRRPLLFLRIARPPIHRCGPKWCPALLTMPGRHRQWGPVARGWRAGTSCGFNRRALVSHLRHQVIPRPPLPAPHLKMLHRHPSVWGGISGI